MKKRTWLLLLALALLLMVGCSSEKTMGGTITEYLRGDTEVNAFLMEQDGKTIGVRLTGETGIYPALVDITDEALRNAEYPHRYRRKSRRKAHRCGWHRSAHLYRLGHYHQ